MPTVGRATKLPCHSKSQLGNCTITFPERNGDPNNLSFLFLFFCYSMLYSTGVAAIIRTLTAYKYKLAAAVMLFSSEVNICTMAVAIMLYSSEININTNDCSCNVLQLWD